MDLRPWCMAAFAANRVGSSLTAYRPCGWTHANRLDAAVLWRDERMPNDTITHTVFFFTYLNWRAAWLCRNKQMLAGAAYPQCRQHCIDSLVAQGMRHVSH